jgi:hypothetical protein
MLDAYIVTNKKYLTKKSITPINTMLAVDQNRQEAITKALSRLFLFKNY